MKVAVLAPVWFAVPPTGYGGIEWIVSLLADGLVDAGHDVTLFASGDSQTKAKLSALFDVAPSHLIGQAETEIRHALACYERADDFDVVNDHSGPPAAALSGAVATPVVHTVHGPLNGVPGELYESVARVAPRLGLISVSLNQRKPKPDLPWIANCPNALDFSLYPCKPHRGDYLLFLGRMSPDKGAHRAIAVAMETGLPLKLAGKRNEPSEHDYFAEYVEPHLVDGIERPVGVYVADVMRSVPGRGEAVEADDPLSDDLGVRLRERRELAPERVEGLAVQPPGAPFEPARIDEVRRAHLRDVDAQARVLLHEHAGGAGMVEVDVREEEG